MIRDGYKLWRKLKRIITDSSVAKHPYQYMLWLTRDIVSDDYYNRLISLPEAKADFSDIRVVDESGTPVTFAILQSLGKYQLWIKIPVGSPQIYDIYYGNSVATSISNPSMTFMFYDGFEDEISENWTFSLTPHIPLTDGGTPPIINNQMVVEGKQNASYIDRILGDYSWVKVKEYDDSDYFQITIPETRFLSNLPYTFLISFEVLGNFFGYPYQGVSFEISDGILEQLKFSVNNHLFNIPINPDSYIQQFYPIVPIGTASGPSTGSNMELYFQNHVGGGGFSVDSYCGENSTLSHGIFLPNLTINSVKMGYGLYDYSHPSVSHQVKINHIIGVHYQISNLNYRWLSNILGPYDQDPNGLYFTVNPTPARTFEDVQFSPIYNLEDDYDNYAWSFGDGHISYLPSATHRYELPGIYDVTLYGAPSRGFPQYSHTEQIAVSSGTEVVIIRNPSTKFAAKPYRGIGPLSVQFIPDYTGADSYSWDFGDGETSSEQNPLHIYTNIQAYTVKLTVTKGLDILTEVYKNFIQVTETDPPVAGFTHSLTNNSGSVPVAVNFTDASTGTITEGEWQFGDGGTSTDENPTHVYSKAGYYFVRRIVRNDEYEDELTELFYIRQRSPTIRIHANQVSGPTPLTVTFTPVILGSYIRFQWSFGNGDTSVENNPEHTYTTPGEYTVTLTVWNTSTLHSTSETITITAIDPALFPSAEYSSDVTSGTAPVTVTFTDASIGTPASWRWDFGDGNTSTEQSPEHIYTIPGTYTVSLTASNTHGSNTETKIDYIKIGADPVSVPRVDADVHHLSHEFTFSSESGNEPTSYLWDFGDGITSTEATVSLMFTEVKSYWVTLTVTNAYGSHTSGIDIMVVPNSYPIPIFTWFTSNKKAPYTMQFSDASVGTPTSWLWDFGDGTISTEQSPEHIYQYPGTYTVSLTVSNAYGTVSTTEEVLDVTN